MGKLQDSSQKHDTDEFPILPYIPRNTRELERKNQGFFQFMSGGHSYAPDDLEPDTDPSIPIVKPSNKAAT